MLSASIERFFRFGFGLLAAAFLLSALVALSPGKPDMSVSIHTRRPVSEVVAEALPYTLKNLGKGFAYALPLALVLGIPAGLRPNSPLDRVLQTPAVALAGVPAAAGVLLSIYVLSVKYRALPFQDAARVALVLLMAAWLARAVRHALADVRTDGAVLSKGRAVAAIVGRMLQQSGNLLIITMLVEVVGALPGLLRLLNHAMYQRDLPVVYGVLWVIVPAVLVAHLAGDLLVTAAMGERKPEGRISRSWLVVGLALTLVLLIAPLFAGGDPNALNLAGRLRPPGEAGTLGTDMLGRDLLGRIGHGARVSLTIAAVSTFLATFAGGIIATVAWALGRWGMAILTPRTAVPNLFGPLLTGLVAVMIFRPSVTVLMIAFGLASIPSMIVAFRKLYRPDRTVHPASTALPAMAGVMLLTFAQILLAEIALSFLAFGVQPPSASLGNMIHETTQYIRVAPHLFWTMVPSALGLAGLFLVGHSLADSSRGEG